jgi:hypothetical protein
MKKIPLAQSKKAAISSRNSKIYIWITGGNSSYNSDNKFSMVNGPLCCARIFEKYVPDDTRLEMTEVVAKVSMKNHQKLKMV